MEKFELKASAHTPYIHFNAQSGEMIIQGRSISQPDEDFWAPVLKWFYAYAAAPHKTTHVIFNLEYFNISSSKQILFLLHKLNDLLEEGHDVHVEWRYTEDDLEMKESGFDFSCVVNVPFEFKCVPVEVVPSI
ncbi:DUF1987 domain-containing protein [Brumimicrobium oceani]|uniref:Nuclear pore complex subunit n=1 Tax=Brumimicrobium oceani TaxID=2100725 RepID=A0A2U2XF46_9FLAO|nr:DUF1987 domain-containing protein [Brumimicrobium oceani]PWH86377.1 nuclear pore complex subunit [Brumimicrobium oceani]